MSAGASIDTASREDLTGDNTTSASMTDVHTHRYTLGWVLRRAALGLFILVVAMGGMAWLIHASIEISAEEAPVADSILNSIARTASNF